MSTTTHGFKHIFTECCVSTTLLWVFRILCLPVFLILVINSIIAFRSIPTATTVYTDHVSSLTFPAVTVCNLNGYNLSYLEENNLTEIVTEAIYKGGERKGDYNKECASFVPPGYPENITLFETVHGTSQSRDSLIAKCHFLGQTCQPSMFTEYQVPNGKCFTFNGNKEENPLSVHGSGFRHNLELVLNIQQDKFGGSVNGEVGALVSVHDYDGPALVWESGINVPVGHSAYLAVTNEQIEDRTNRARSTKENRECIQPEEAKPFELFTSYNYSFRACRGECITRDLANTCQCLWTNSSDSEYRNCNISDICCIYDVLKFPTNCPCPVLCNHTSYEVVPSYSTFPSVATVNNIADKFNISRETVRNNYLKVHVFYNSLSIVREITERSYSLTELIANIGGNMGLFLGVGIVTVLEFLLNYTCMSYIKDKYLSIKEKRKEKKYAIDRKPVTVPINQS